jgi:hypothetical protein
MKKTLQISALFFVFLYLGTLLADFVPQQVAEKVAKNQIAFFHLTPGQSKTLP